MGVCEQIDMAKYTYEKSKPHGQNPDIDSILESRMKTRCLLLFSILVLIALVSCNNESKDTTYTGFSVKADSILHDTVAQSLYVDSMRAEVLEATNDTDRVRWLNELAATWRGPQGRIMADEAKRISSENKDLYGIADSESRIALCFSRDNKYKAADSVLSIAEKLAVERKFNYILSRVYIQRADIQRFQGNSVAALPTLDSAIEIAQERKYEDLLAWAYASKGDIYQSMHKYDSSRFCLNRTLEYSEKLNDKSRIAMAYGIVAVVCRFQSKMDSSFFYINKVLALSKELRDKYRMTTGYSTLGEMYRMQNDDAHALLYFDSARVLAQEIGHKNQLAYCLGSMGSIYRLQNQNDRALNYYLVALSISREVKNKVLIATNLSTIGDVYLRMGEPDTALAYLTEALDLAKVMRDPNRQGFAYVAIAAIYRDSGLYERSLQELRHSDTIAQNTNYENLKAISWNGMSMTYSAMGDFKNASLYGEKAYDAAVASKMPTNIQDVSNQLYRVYDKLGDKSRALEMYIEYIEARDSVENQEEIRRFAQVEYAAKEGNLKAENAAKLAEAEAEEAVKDEQLNKNRIVLSVVIVAFCLLGVLAFFIYRSLRANKKAKLIIEHQKAIVDEKNKSIHDSITYARRLQDAIIPDESEISKSFRDFFILYLPKDIVAGDFYWHEKTDTHIFLAAADCTGHGVPGALVSVVCSNALNRAIHEYHLREPGEILDKTRELVIETFRKSHHNVQDGMDISLTAWPLNWNDKVSIRWAGAQNPLWIVRKGPPGQSAAQAGIIMSINGNKQPVGKWDVQSPFTTHTVELEKGDLVILLTDGYADQFGGPAGKKIKYRKLEELIVDSSNLSMEAQRERLNEFFINWRGDLDQVDDVTIIGLRV